jgi:hypothetical protein
VDFLSFFPVGARHGDRPAAPAYLHRASAMRGFMTSQHQVSADGRLPETAPPAP